MYPIINGQGRHQPARTLRSVAAAECGIPIRTMFCTQSERMQIMTMACKEEREAQLDLEGLRQ